MADSAWTRTFYPREGEGTGFDRVVFFSDAVFAIAITLAAVEIGVPAFDGDTSSVSRLAGELADTWPSFLAYFIAFFWIAFYWLANHRFTTTLRGMNSHYIIAVMWYLVLIALLPIPASLLGEFLDNPLAVALFAFYVCLVSGMEVVLFVVADSGSLFRAPLSRDFRREQIVGSASPIGVFLLSVPLAFWSPAAAVVLWFVGGLALQVGLNRFLHGEPPADPAENPDGEGV